PPRRRPGLRPGQPRAVRTHAPLGPRRRRPPPRRRVSGAARPGRTRRARRGAGADGRTRRSGRGGRRTPGGAAAGGAGGGGAGSDTRVADRFGSAVGGDAFGPAGRGDEDPGAAVGPPYPLALWGATRPCLEPSVSPARTPNTRKPRHGVGCAGASACG